VITLDVQPQGERFVFFSEPDPGAPSLEFEMTAAPGAGGPDPHIHAKQVETFRVVSGGMQATLGKEERIIRAGESLVVPAGQVHRWRNLSESEPLVVRIRVEPALQFQWMMTEYSRLAIANGGRWKDAPLLEVGYILHRTRDEHEIPGMPHILTSLFLASLAGLAVLLGRHRRISPLPTLMRAEYPSSLAPAPE
jgi:mannose-6-phosphate isomerase-like protein (cupin superfamily)